MRSNKPDLDMRSSIAAQTDSVLVRDDAALAVAGIAHPERLAHASILIAGASGIIGSHLVRALHALNAQGGYDIRITAATRHANRLHALFAGMADVDCLALDVSSPDAESQARLGRFFPYSAIVHAASQANPAAFTNEPVQTMLSNIEGTKNLLDGAKSEKEQEDCSCTVLYVSSGEVYGSTRSTALMAENDCGSMDPMDPRSCYPSAKRASETLCASYCAQYGIDVRVARPSHVFGPDFRPSDNRISADFFVRAAHGEPIALRSAGTDVRTYIYAADCASGILSILTAGTSGEAYNVTNSGNSITMREFSRRIASAGDVPFTAANPPRGDASTALHRASALSDAKLRSLGWSPSVGIDEGIARTFDWLRTLQN